MFHADSMSGAKALRQEQTWFVREGRKTSLGGEECAMGRGAEADCEGQGFGLVFGVTSYWRVLAEEWGTGCGDEEPGEEACSHPGQESCAHCQA